MSFRHLFKLSSSSPKALILHRSALCPSLSLTRAMFPLLARRFMKIFRNCKRSKSPREWLPSDQTRDHTC